MSAASLDQLRRPPNSVEAEMALLGAMIESNRLINELDFLDSSDFFRHENQIIFTKLQALAFLGKPADAVTLCNSLDAVNELDMAGGAEYVIELVTQSRGPHNARSYAEIVKDKSKSRQLIQIAYRIAELGYEEGEPGDKVDEAQTLMLSLTDQGSSEAVSISDAMREAANDIQKRFDSKGEIIGLSTGFKDLDRLTSGLQPGQMVVVAGRPAMGKTTFAMNIAEHAMLNDKFVLAFNLEMTSSNLAMKSMSSLGRVPYSLLRAGQIGDHSTHIGAAAAKIKGRSMFIDDNVSLTSQQVLSRARKIQNKAGKKIDLMIVDYLQLLNDKGEGHERITRISRAMKIAAKELGCPVIVLSQLNRSLENRGDKRPIMSDLRESGAIEQDADLIIMLYRDEVYSDDSREKGIAQAIIRKNREGENGTVYLKSNLHICRFDNLEQSYIPPAYELKKSGKKEFEYA